MHPTAVLLTIHIPESDALSFQSSRREMQNKLGQLIPPLCACFTDADFNVVHTISFGYEHSVCHSTLLLPPCYYSHMQTLFKLLFRSFFGSKMLFDDEKKTRSQVKSQQEAWKANAKQNLLYAYFRFSALLKLKLPARSRAVHAKKLVSRCCSTRLPMALTLQ